MRLRPVSPDLLAREVADRICGISGWVRVGIDGADAARPEELADALVDLVRVAGRAVFRVRSADHLRPASLRFERGRTDPEGFYEDWLDVDGLRREVLDPLAPDDGAAMPRSLAPGGAAMPRSQAPGGGRIRPVRWDAVADRASRTDFVTVPAGGVVILSGPLLLGRGLPLDLTVHLDLSPSALARRTPANLQWTLPAYARYADEVVPTLVADIVVRVNDARHPAMVDGPPTS